MAAATMDPPKGKEEAKASDAKSAEGKAEGAAPAGGGLKAFLPLIIAVVLMPVLAFAMTRFVLLPKLQTAVAGGKPAAAAAAPEAKSEGGEGAKEGAPAAGKSKVPVEFTKLLCNVAGTMGTRYLMTSFTVIGGTPEFKDKVLENMPQLKDLALATLGSKTIADLEKPGSRNLIRTELQTAFNSVLGPSAVQEIYITDLAIQ